MLPLVDFYDYGGTGPVVHLAHANGFPPATYWPLAQTLLDRYRIVGLPLRPLWPGVGPEVEPGWRPMAHDLVAALEAARWGPIVGAGHSLGGVLTLWAALARPDLFRAVVLIDPVLLSRVRLCLLRLLRLLRLESRQPLVRGALRRTRAWPSRQACFDDLRRKPFFARWSTQALWAYVDAGTREREGGGVELVYPPEWEAHIFATSPLDTWSGLAGLRMPVLVVRGELSQVFQPCCERRLARVLKNARFVTIAGAGHMVPMERPLETGAAIRAFVDKLDPPGDWR